VIIAANKAVEATGYRRLTADVQATSGFIAWIIAGAFFGTIIFLTNRRQKDWGETVPHKYLTEQ